MTREIRYLAKGQIKVINHTNDQDRLKGEEGPVLPLAVQRTFIDKVLLIDFSVAVDVSDGCRWIIKRWHASSSTSWKVSGLACSFGEFASSVRE